VPDRFRDQMRIVVEVKGHAITFLSLEGLVGPDGEPISIDVARLRYTARRGEWDLYWFDSDSKPHRRAEVGSRKSVKTFLTFIDDDPTGIFWG
jgi:hypothetical protein